MPDRTEIAAEHDKDKNDQEASPDSGMMSPPHPPARLGIARLNASENKQADNMKLFDINPDGVNSEQSGERKNACSNGNQALSEYNADAPNQIP